MRKNRNVFLLGSIGLIILAIGLVAILQRTQPTGTSSTDVRARAATVNTLMVNATVSAVDPAKNTITVDNLYFSDKSRSGQLANLGMWLVTPPATFDYTTVSPGTTVTIGIDAPTFLASTHTLTAITITPTK